VTPVELTKMTQVILDAYINASTSRTRAEFGEPTLGVGIRLRQPAVVDIPPEFNDLPNLDHDSVFPAGTGPEFSPVAYRFLDLCPLDRVDVSVTDFGAHIDFIFVVRYGPGEIDPDPNKPEPVCLVSGDELSTIVSECLNQLQQAFGSNDELAGADAAFTPMFTTSMQVLTSKELKDLGFPPVETL
jgi:hypothetical protein